MQYINIQCLLVESIICGIGAEIYTPLYLTLDFYM